MLESEWKLPKGLKGVEARTVQVNKIKLNLQVKYITHLVETVHKVEIVYPDLSHFSSQGWLTMAMAMVQGYVLSEPGCWLQ